MPNDTPLPERAALTPDALGAAIKEAVAEVLHEQRELIQEIVEDALQEMALAEALREIEVHERRFGQRPGFAQVEGEA